MKQRIAKARRGWAALPKRGFVRPPKEPTERQIVTAYYFEDLAAIQRIPRKGDARTLQRVIKACENLMASAGGLTEYRTAGPQLLEE